MATDTKTRRTVRDMLEMLSRIPDEHLDSNFRIEMPTGQYDFTTDCELHWDETKGEYVVLDMTDAPHATS